MPTMHDHITIRPFADEFGPDILRLIVGIQQEEFGLPITAVDQPDLMNIPGFYRRGCGNFWVAVCDGRVVGTIALLDIGEKRAALRKMFVGASFRGSATGTARKLLDTLLAWSRQQNLLRLYLGTTPRFLAAHRFYEKNGFREIRQKELPAAFPVMKVDTRFYTCEL